MDDEAYKLEEAVLFNRYGIVGYSTDTPDVGADTPGDSVDNDVC